MHRRTTVIATVLAALIGLTGCSLSTGTPSATTTTPTATPSATPAPAPADILTAAVTKTAGVSYRVTFTGASPDQSAPGSFDATHHISTMKFDADTVVVTPTAIYLSGDPRLKGKAIRYDLTKLAATNALAGICDTQPVMTLLSAAVKITSNGPGRFAGTLDLTQGQASTTGAQKFLAHVTQAAGPKAHSITFTASVNPEGYVIEFDATLPGLDNGQDTDYHALLSGFGAKITNVQPKASSVIDAPPSAYTA
jgi:hypothetical protein